MKSEKIKIKKLFDNAIVPIYGTEHSAGADLYAYLDRAEEIKPGETKFISTGVCMEIPEGLVGLVYARSGLACKQGLAPANKVGAIDSDYRGELKLIVENPSRGVIKIPKGIRIAQCLIEKNIPVKFTEVEELSETKRSTGGLGSTGEA